MIPPTASGFLLSLLVCIFWASCSFLALFSSNLRFDFCHSPTLYSPPPQLSFLRLELGWYRSSPEEKAFLGKPGLTGRTAPAGDYFPPLPPSLLPSSPLGVASPGLGTFCFFCLQRLLPHPTPQHLCPVITYSIPHSYLARA